MVGITYSDFQNFSIQIRLDSLKWLRGRREPTDYYDDIQQLLRAANDPYEENIAIIVLNVDYVNCLYCWEACGRDEVLAKLTYTEDIAY